MQKKIQLRLKPEQASDPESIKQLLAGSLALKTEQITGFHILKKSLDARGKSVYFNLSLLAFINEPLLPLERTIIHFQDVLHASKKVIIIGAGPAGLFCALKLIESGIKPIIIERGKDVRSRRRDLAQLNKTGIINEESNYCYGEGGAGTYSDGKLYTRSNKRGDINRIINLFIQFGAPESIGIDAHPHIGTNKLPGIITAMREQIIKCGGEVHFEQKMVDFIIENNELKGIKTQNESIFHADDVILATGHSARDVFELLYKKNILIESKPFALGVRIEHPQCLIDSIQYHSRSDLPRSLDLPPASYSLVEQVKGKGVFSFCMCPGGIIAPASTQKNELVVNGWSPSKRNNPFANSGMVVSVEQKDAMDYLKDSSFNIDHPLLLMEFQKQIEMKAFQAGGGNFQAPALRMTDFCNNTLSSSLPENSYIPGLNSADLRTVLPAFIYQHLSDGFKAFGKKMKGYYSQDAVVVATESRTSSPVKIPRDSESLHHPQFKNLYPCGEGAGFAGGIVSAAMDGERIADVIVAKYA
jgi:uncharacterized FAD-dependent dehydrogenase